MKKDDIKTLIVVIIICLICAALAFLFGRKSNMEKLTGVTEYNTYFAVVNSINEYINYISDNDSKGVYSLLYDDYVTTRGIDEINVFNHVSNFSLDESFRVTGIKSSKIANNYYLYYVEGKIIKNTYDTTETINDDYKILVIDDYDNLAKAIYPINTGDNIKKIINGIKRKSIFKNDYNGIKGTGIIREEQICSLYLSDYVDYLFNDIDKAYNLINTDMKQKYSNDDFKKLIKENENSISFIADKCLVSNNSKGSVYRVIDSNDNRYYFREKSIMDYSVTVEFFDENTMIYTTDPDTGVSEEDIFGDIENANEESD